MPLKALPTEVLLEIMGKVQFKSDLLKICLVSKQLCEVTQPQLYSTFGETNSNSLILFLRTILERPHLAPYVKSLIGYSAFTSARGSYPRLFREDRFHNLNLEDQRRIEVALKAANAHNESTEAAWWEKRFWDGGWNARFALLLCQLPNLKSISVAPRIFDDIYSVLHRVISRATDLQNSGEKSPHNLASLSKFSLGSHPLYQPPHISSHFFGTLESMDERTIILFLGLPSVTHFYAGDIDINNFYFLRGPIGLLPKSSIANLQLSQCSSSFTSLERLVRCFPHLKGFEYDLPRHELGNCLSRQIRQALLHSKDTLEYLRITAKPCYKPLGSLREFRRLKSLELTYGFMFGEDLNCPDGSGFNSPREYVAFDMESFHVRGTSERSAITTSGQGVLSDMNRLSDLKTFAGIEVPVIKRMLVARVRAMIDELPPTLESLTIKLGQEGGVLFFAFLSVLLVHSNRPKSLKSVKLDATSLQPDNTTPTCGRDFGQDFGLEVIFLGESENKRDYFYGLLRATTLLLRDPSTWSEADEKLAGLLKDRPVTCSDLSTPHYYHWLNGVDTLQLAEDK